MDSTWITVAIIWAIAETVQILRKKSFPARMQAPALWVVICGGLLSAGYTKPDQSPFLSFIVGAALYGVVAGVVYWGRVLVSQLWPEQLADKLEKNLNCPQVPMKNLTKIFNKATYLLVPLALTGGLLSSDKVMEALVKKIAPSFTEWQIANAKNPKAGAQLKSDCENFGGLKGYQWFYQTTNFGGKDIDTVFSIARAMTVGPCDITLADLVIDGKISKEENEQNRAIHSYEVNMTFFKVRDFLGEVFALSAYLLLFFIGFNAFQVYIKPWLRRLTAPARSRSLEQEFLRLKMLHENGVLSDEEFAVKKDAIRLKIMADS